MTQSADSAVREALRKALIENKCDSGDGTYISASMDSVLKAIMPTLATPQPDREAVMRETIAIIEHEASLASHMAMNWRNKPCRDRRDEEDYERHARECDREKDTLKRLASLVRAQSTTPKPDKEAVVVTQEMISAADYIIPYTRGTESYRGFPTPEKIYAVIEMARVCGHEWRENTPDEDVCLKCGASRAQSPTPAKEE